MIKMENCESSLINFGQYHDYKFGKDLIANLPENAVRVIVNIYKVLYQDLTFLQFSLILILNWYYK